MDAYAWARLNFTDIRYAPEGGKASMGTAPGIALDTEMVRKVLDEAHRRGMFVYGTVSCSVPARKHLAVLMTFRQLISLGVDGLWLSFDDRGPGEDPSGLVTKVLALGKSHGMTGWKIAITPPAGSYQRIKTGFNQQIAQVPGMAEARWFFTRVPCLADARAAEAIGLKRRPSWWHNWPRTPGGFTHEGYGGRSLRADGKPAYLDLPPLTLGWGGPRYSALRSAPACCEAVMMWGMWPEDYVCGVLGIWAWHPEEHDWERTRRAVYAHVFGPAAAADAAAFDDRLATLKSHFTLSKSRAHPGRDWPPILRQDADKAKALALVGDLRKLLARIEPSARDESALPQGRLERLFIEPMRAGLDFAKRAAELEDPTAVLQPLEEKVGQLLAAGEAAELERLISQVEEQAIAAAERNAERMKGLVRADEAVRALRARLAQVRRCVAADDGKTKKLDVPFRQCRAADIARRLEPLSKPPMGGRVIAKLRGQDWLAGNVQWWGPVTIGRAASDAGSAIGVLFGHPPRKDAVYLAQFETELKIPRSAFAQKLRMDVFLSDPIHYNGRPTGRVAQLWVDGRLVLQRDLGSPWNGKEWASVPLETNVNGKSSLRIRLRLEDSPPRTAARTVVFIGPLLLKAE